MLEEDPLIQLLISLLPSPLFMALSVAFGIIGMVCFYSGRKKAKPRLKWGGVALMFYPYLIGNDTRLLVVVGLALCAGLFFWRE